MIRVAVDAMGGDSAPAAEVDGAALALREMAADFSITLVGQPEPIERELARHPGIDRTRLAIVPAADVIGMNEKPLAAVRRKPNSSLVVGLTLHREGHADAFVSAGNTGATLAASTIILGLHDGVGRATVASLFPTADGPVLVLDAGANVDCSSRELVNFARIGSIYMHDVVGRAEPLVGLLNVGEEDEKGTAIIRETHRMLQRQPRLNYAGNVEGRDVVMPHPKHGHIDVVVCDGFVGNVVLKFYESIGGLVLGVIKRDCPTLVGSREIEPLLRFLDVSEYGGAPLLGVKGVAIICHGASTGLAIKNAIRGAVESARGGLAAHIQAELAQHETSTVA
ncbi:MAG TPA: phosphate acyltransferase PlsX [Gemmatimonadales bacterium]|nr:phosphate acyltransferase PlsX [Gemmatimonadales bacterium]